MKHDLDGRECVDGVIGEAVPGSHPHHWCRGCGWVSWSDLEGECSETLKAFLAGVATHPDDGGMVLVKDPQE